MTNKSKEKVFLGFETVARIACILQEGMMLEKNVVKDLKEIELVETVDDEDGKTYLVLSEEYLQKLPEEAGRALKNFIELDDLN